MATPDKAPKTPAYTIAGLANIPIRDGMTASDIAYLCNSQSHTLETLAGVIAVQEHQLRRVMARTTGGGMDGIRARAAANRATRPMRQCVNRTQAAAASARACWRAVTRAFAPLIQPKPTGKGKGPNWQK